MLHSKDPLQEALSASKFHSFYTIPGNHSNFFKTQKYDFEHFGLTFMQRITAFCISALISGLLFVYALTRFMSIILSPLKFALPYSLSNLVFFFMFGFLTGFKTYLVGTMSEKKRVYTLCFIALTLVTIFSSFSNLRYFTKLLIMIAQAVSFVLFAISALPGGASGLSSLMSLMLKK